MVTLKNIVRKSKSPLPFKKTDPCTILPSPFIVYWILLEGRQKKGGPTLYDEQYRYLYMIKKEGNHKNLFHCQF